MLAIVGGSIPKLKSVFAHTATPAWGGQTVSDLACPVTQMIADSATRGGQLDPAQGLAMQ